IPKLTDFGLAKDLTERHAANLTASGAVLGTPMHMSPEQMRGRRELDGRTDIWGVASTMYLAATGKPPFHATTLVDLAARIVLAPVKPPSGLAEQIPPAFDALLLRALEKDPKNRYASAREFRAALREFMAQHGLQEPQQGLSSTGEVRVQERLARASVAPVPTRSDAREPLRARRSQSGASLARPLRIGVVVHEKAKVFQLENGFSGALGLRCKVWGFARYGELIDAIGEGDVDCAWLPPVAYVRARRSGSPQLLLTVERAGQASFCAALLARPGSVGSLQEMSSTRAAWVDPWSAAGYLMPLAMLRERGLGPSTLFSSQAFVGSHNAVLDCLRAGTADICGTFCVPDGAGGFASKPWSDADGFKVLAVSSPIPGDTICAASGLAEPLTQRVVDALLDERRSPDVLALLGASRLVRAAPSSYDALESALLPSHK
ncbi:MAG: PhnD/SsuA/transferrin family substrate-binding protein, partial [Polyangiaceae bacterium]|nr:PhnD/SsuA/transferrin family substrate-binding protein [Polyangiaceae bacterium]